MIGIAIANSLGLNFLRGIFGPYKSRVEADGGVTEAGQCVEAGATPLLQTASLLLIPSGYKGGKLYSEIPTSGAGDSTWTRASDGTRVNASGVIQRVPWNLASYSEEFGNAYWTKGNFSTVSSNVTTAPNGTSTADKHVSANSTAAFALGNFSFSVINATTYTFSAYVKKSQVRYVQFRTAIAGNLFCNFDLDLGIAGTPSAGLTQTITSVGDGWYRVSITATANATATSGFAINMVTSLTASLALAYPGNGVDGYFVWGAQIVQGSSAETYLPTTDRFGFPRLDYSFGSCPGVWVEGQRTNGIRNSTMVGASTSPSTFPTNYTGAGTIVGVGIENGLNYFDLRFNGTAATTNVDLFNPETTTAIAALTGQVWSQSVYLKFVSTTNPPNSNQITALMFELNSSGGFVASAGFIQPTITSTLTRYNLTATLSGGASTAFVRPVYRFPATIGQSYDFTIRIASPQMEIGAFPSTWIPTTTASATRLTDTNVISGISSLIGQTQGVVFFDMYYNLVTNGGFRVFASLEGTVSGVFSGFSISTGNNFNNVQFSGLNYNIPSNGRYKVACLYNSTTNTSKLFVNGVLRGTGTFSGFANTVSQIAIGARINTFSGFAQDRQAFVPFYNFAIFPTALTDAQCVALTT